MHRWRFIEMETRDAYENMALDEAVCEQIAENESPPTIRFYRFMPRAISIGYFQGLHDEIKVDACRAAGVEVVRRRTGGEMFFHDGEGEISYSIIAQESFFPKGFVDSYRVICGWIMDGLAQIGIETFFIPINNVALADDVLGDDEKTGHVVALGKKNISVSAQTRRSGVLLQHGIIRYKTDFAKVRPLLVQSAGFMEENQSSVLAVRPDLQYADVYSALCEGFLYGKRWEKGEWTLAEMMRANELTERRYATKDWNEMR